MGGGKAREAVRGGVPELRECVLEGEYSSEKVEGFYRSRFEDARHAAEGIVLGSLGKFDEGGVVGESSPERGAIGEDREDDGVENSPPIHQIEASDRVC